MTGLIGSAAALPLLSTVCETLSVLKNTKAQPPFYRPYFSTQSVWKGQRHDGSVGHLRLVGHVRRREEEEEEEFIQNRTRAGARFLTRWDQHAVAQRRP